MVLRPTICLGLLFQKRIKLEKMMNLNIFLLTMKSKMLLLGVIGVFGFFVGTRMLDESGNQNSVSGVEDDSLLSKRREINQRHRASQGPAHSDLSSLIAVEGSEDQKVIAWQISTQNGDFQLSEYQDFISGLEAGPLRDRLLIALAYEAGKSGDLRFIDYLDSVDNGKFKTNAIAEFSFRISGAKNVMSLLEWAERLEFPEERDAIHKNVGANLGRLDLGELKTLSSNPRIGELGIRVAAWALGTKLSGLGGDLDQIRNSDFQDFSDAQWKTIEESYWRHLPSKHPEIVLNALREGKIPELVRTQSALAVFNGYMKEGYKAAFEKVREIEDQELKARIYSHISSSWAFNDINDLTEFALSLDGTPGGVPDAMVKQIVDQLVRLDDLESAKSWGKLRKPKSR